MIHTCKRREGPGLVFGAGYGVREAIDIVVNDHIDRIMNNETVVTTFVTDKALPLFVNDRLRTFPDFVLALNTEKTKDVEVEKWLKGDPNIRMADTHLVLPVTAHPSHVRIWMENWDGEIIWVVPCNIDSDLAAEWSLKYGSPTYPRGANCGEFAWMMANIMCCDPIGLIGMPYAWKTLVEVLEGQTKESYDYHHFYGNGKHCYTTLPFMEQRTEFIEAVAAYGSGRTFNLSEGGILYDQHYLKRMELGEFLKEYR